MTANGAGRPAEFLAELARRYGDVLAASAAAAEAVADHLSAGTIDADEAWSRLHDINAGVGDVVLALADPAGAAT